MNHLSLRTAADQAGILFGAACSPDRIENDPPYAQLLAREFSCIVAENAMKPMYLQPERGRFEFSEADKLTAFADMNDQQLRGHTLCWHNQMPSWLREGTFDHDTALGLLDAHVTAVVDHFRGKVFAWDVVNEALADDGGWRTKSPWHQMAGSDYLAKAFHAAHAADPDCKLFYNDYCMEQPGLKADGCLRMLQALLDDGVPVHGVGFQYHLGLDNQLEAEPCVANLKRFHDLGLKVHVTEMDMGIPVPVTDEKRQEQADEYARRIRFLVESGVVSAILLWGCTDRYSWIPKFTNGEFDEALPFDKDLNPKPAAEAIRDVLMAQKKSA